MEIPWVDTAPHDVETQPHRLIANWLSLVEPAMPGKDKVPSPDHKAFQTPETSHNPGMKKAVPRAPVDTTPNGLEIAPPSADCWLARAHRASARGELPLRPMMRSHRTRGG